MINFDDHTKENIKKHNSDWPQIPDDLYRILIIQGSGSGKTNSILNLINEEQDIDKIYLYTNDSYGAKHILINKINSASLKNFNEKQKLQQIAFNHLSNIDFKDFMNLYKKCNARVIDATPPSDNPPRFRNNLLERV